MRVFIVTACVVIALALAVLVATALSGKESRQEDTAPVCEDCDSGEHNRCDGDALAWFNIGGRWTTVKTDCACPCRRESPGAAWLRRLLEEGKGEP